MEGGRVWISGVILGPETRLWRLSGRKIWIDDAQVDLELQLGGVELFE